MWLSAGMNRRKKPLFATGDCSILKTTSQTIKRTQNKAQSEADYVT